MRWLGFALAWIVAPALVVAIAWLVAVFAGITFMGLLVIGAIALVLYILQSIARRVSCELNPNHRLNRKYLPDRLRHIPY